MRKAGCNFVDHIDHKYNMNHNSGGKLNQPEAEQGQRCKYIVTHVDTARLDSVTHKSLLLILVEWIASQEQD